MPKGGLIGYQDFSTLEIRVMAALSKDEGLIKILNSGADLHCSTAQQIWPSELAGKSIEEIKEKYAEHRSRAKAAIFGIAYGASANSLSESFNISLAEAQGIVDGLFQGFPGIPEFIKESHAHAIKHGYVVTALGRKVLIPDALIDLNDKTKVGLRNHALRFSQNVRIQSPSSELAYICSSHIWDDFKLLGMRSRLLGSVHDSIECDIYPGELIDQLYIYKYHGEIVPNTIYPWLNGIKMKTDQETGVSWGRGVEVKRFGFTKDLNYFDVVYSGGNTNIRQMLEEMDGYYDYEVIDRLDKDPYEKPENTVLEPNTHDVKITLRLKNNSRVLNRETGLMEFKSKYHIGDHTKLGPIPPFGDIDLDIQQERDRSAQKEYLEDAVHQLR